ncbi:MAG: hypoxanthine phosphoribosyltransferase [Thermodesulfovibrionales bacterium]|nr:hypoxanthine phosphoribosyltransferase [Thermodesulfovibrionales bacterium]
MRLETIFSTETLHSKVLELANKISSDYKDSEIFAIGILKGAFIFFADIIRAITVPTYIDFMIASSYQDTSSTGVVKIHSDISANIANKDVLLIDDIVDTGISLNFIRNHLLKKNPATLKICVLFDKKARRVIEVPIDYVGFEIPNEFVVGYGLDYNNKYRNLPYLAILKK